MNKKKKDSN